MTIADLRRSYRRWRAGPVDVLRDVFRRIRSEGERPIWISLADERSAPRAGALRRSVAASGRRAFCGQGQHRHRGDADHRSRAPPSRVRAGDDGAGGATAAGCRSDSRRQDEPRSVRHGTRRACVHRTAPARMRSIRDTSAGGSSSGSAVATATGLCAFALAHGHGRIRPCSGRLQQPRRPETDARTAQHHWARARVPLARLHVDLSP